MKRLYLSCAALCLGFVLTGCELLLQAGPGLTTGRDEYLRSIKPALHYWEKPAMTVEGKQSDWVKCGGRLDGGYTPDARLPSETDDFAAMRRKQQKLGACMEMKGYRFSRSSAK